MAHLNTEMKPDFIRPQLQIRPFEPISKADYFNIISTVAFTALFIVSISLSIYYGMHPVGKMFPVTANFSLALPVLITSSLGAAALILFSIQVSRKRVTYSFERGCGQMVYSNEFLGRLVRMVLHPAGREQGTGEEYCKEHKGRIVVICRTLASNAGVNAEIRDFLTRDSIILRGIWQRLPKDNAPTVVLLHGNGMVAEHMFEWGMYYLEKGFNVLLPEYRGYGMSEGKAAEKDQELHAYYDAEAMVNFLKQEGVNMDKVVVHGYSLGGAYAAAMGYFFKIKHVILDHTFTNFAAVMSHAVKSYTGIGSLTYGSTAEMVLGAYPLTKDKDIKQERLSIETDGWNSLEKVRKMKDSEIFVIRGKKDKLMDLSFGSQFVEANYKDKALQQKRLVTISGGHCDCFEFFEDKNAKHMLDVYLKDRGLLN